MRPLDEAQLRAIREQLGDVEDPLAREALDALLGHIAWLDRETSSPAICKCGHPAYGGHYDTGGPCMDPDCDCDGLVVEGELRLTEDEAERLMSAFSFIKNRLDLSAMEVVAMMPPEDNERHHNAVEMLLRAHQTVEGLEKLLIARSGGRLRAWPTPGNMEVLARRMEQPGNVEREAGVLNRVRVVMTMMDPAAGKALDAAMEKWRTQRESWQATRAQVAETFGVEDQADEVYAFAYWLFRYSGLVRPAGR